jgi:hypothetical protein|tara:strand:+ start:1840 stop:2019 length:180 start_codon:yes stop_codon:yes gene_type:complete
MITQQQIDRDKAVNTMIAKKFPGVSFPEPGVCTVYWEPEDWERWIINHRAAVGEKAKEK